MHCPRSLRHFDFQVFIAATCLLVAGLLGHSIPSAAQPIAVTAAVETVPVPTPGDAADDPAIWLHPSDPALSLVIGTDKDAGLGIYDLAGRELAFLADGQMNNVDVRYAFPLGTGTVDIAVAGNRTDDSIAVYAIDPATRTLSNVARGGGIPVSLTVYGSCLYQSPTSGKLYAFFDSKDGDVEQWELLGAADGFVDGQLVRSFAVGSQTEGCVGDDERGFFYIGEENVGIWRYGAEPDAGLARTSIDITSAGGQLTADVEGLSILYAPGGAGYLIASSQGANAFTIYDRGADDVYVGAVQIVPGLAIDGAENTDGIDVISSSLGASFPLGLLAVQDGFNDTGNQNFKFVAWEEIADSFVPPLTTAPGWSPRAVPEPAALLQHLTAILVLASIARTRRKARRTSQSPH